MPNAALQDRLEAVRARIDAHQRRGGWHHPVRLIAVTKTHGPEVVRAARAAGLSEVGENRVQEALEKQDALPGLELSWHLIGTLQRRKVRQIVGRFALVHALDRLELAEEWQRRLDPGSVQPVLVQVNCSAEPQKGGVDPDELLAFLDRLRPLDRLAVQGLMTMAAFDADAATQHRTFGQLRALRDRAEAEGHRLPELSMGMSGDYPIAVEEGATMVRLGTVLFGDRPTPP
ncbi:MAG TPA: YggS family pyridoxal phosphate-dependent enzyme [Gemmatimonadales bacterium]|nr:YggS family pyridoxal phosphate-dependent enzyme [Gemmatimonadota bacterium]HPF61712.1 YggS family pyridoxal phosphate-dependent enzyme [Gemmatimonadales bacterium]HRX18437.1 YggS family pyridoxal phosphate-dependent enzyme [Gemmatimonadales bacterium]